LEGGPPYLCGYFSFLILLKFFFIKTVVYIYNESRLPFYDCVISFRRKRVTAELNHHGGFKAIQAIPGVGPVLAAVFVAEIGDVTRFARPQQLCSWAGMTPKHRESDTKLHRGRITKQGNKLVRWAAVEAVQRLHLGPLASKKAKLTVKRGNNIAKVATARELLTLVFYGLRDGHIRCLTPHQPAA
jgi:transposase